MCSLLYVNYSSINSLNNFHIVQVLAKELFLEINGTRNEHLNGPADKNFKDADLSLKGQKNFTWFRSFRVVLMGYTDGQPVDSRNSNTHFLDFIHCQILSKCLSTFQPPKQALMFDFQPL